MLVLIVTVKMSLLNYTDLKQLCESRYLLYLINDDFVNVYVLVENNIYSVL